MRKYNQNLIRLNPDFVGGPYRNRGKFEKTTFMHEDVSVSTIDNFINSLNSIEEYYLKLNLFDKFLITINFKSVLSKTRRLKRIFSLKAKPSSSFVVGASFYKGNENLIAHKVTYYITKDNLERTISLLKECSSILKKYYNGSFKEEYFKNEKILLDNKLFTDRKSLLSKTSFYDLIQDISNIDTFTISSFNKKIDLDEQITIFSIFENIAQLKEFFNRIGINDGYLLYSPSTFTFKNKFAINKLLEAANFLILQSAPDPHNGDFNEMGEIDTNPTLYQLKDPTSEPTIGVFDTCFDETAFFKKWVDVESSFPDGIYKSYEDKDHGTKVASLIVCGHLFNEKLDDGCGFFKVKLFEVGLNKFINFDYIYQNIEEIVANNLDIKVRNFSIGTQRETSENQISLLAAKIDEISKKYNVLFVISGTNLSKEYPKDTHIGSPSDSLNSVTVNSVKESGYPASYSRKGPILTYFTKPDVSYYGGDLGEELIAYTPLNNNYKVMGTSFAAPWISRKLAYLIHYLKVDPLIAKAMIIDSAAGWNNKFYNSNLIGYGIVPIRIEDVIYGKSDEIKFLISSQTMEWFTGFYNLPIPLDDKKEKFLYTAKLTLCYNTNGKREWGVDYSTTEINIKLGPYSLKRNNKTGQSYFSINSLIKDAQNEDDGYIKEDQAISKLQKWNNVKHIVPNSISRCRGFKKRYGEFWGLEISQNDRGEKNTKKYNINFGLVVTLKNIKGQKADINEFLRLFSANNLRPVLIDLEQEIENYLIMNEEINWE